MKSRTNGAAKRPAKTTTTAAADTTAIERVLSVTKSELGEYLAAVRGKRATDFELLKLDPSPAVKSLERLACRLAAVHKLKMWQAKSALLTFALTRALRPSS